MATYNINKITLPNGDVLNLPSGGGGSTVSVDQIQTSGTEIAQIDVDGTSTSLYAPDAPVTSVNGSTGDVTISVPQPSQTVPIMDGTATIGDGVMYARSNHIHPTDTSRMAASGGTATTPTLKFGSASNASASANPHVELRNSGSAANGDLATSCVYYNSSGTATFHNLVDKSGVFIPEIHMAREEITTPPSSTATSISCANNTWVKVAQVYLYKGINIVRFGGSFASNSTGYRWFTFGTSTPTTSTNPTRYDICVQAANGQVTAISGIQIYNVTTAATYMLYAKQNSGSALNCYPLITVLQLNGNINSSRG